MESTCHEHAASCKLKRMMIRTLFPRLVLTLSSLLRVPQSRNRLFLENLAHRRQLAVLKMSNMRLRPCGNNWIVFWGFLKQFWSNGASFESTSIITRMIDTIISWTRMLQQDDRSNPDCPSRPRSCRHDLSRNPKLLAKAGKNGYHSGSSK